MLIPNLFHQFPDYKPIRGVLHVGAHTFEEEPFYYANGMNDDQILWIEANTTLIPKHKKNVVCAVIGDEDNKEVEFMVTNNMQSSSILNLKTHKEEHPWVHEISRSKRTLITLNTLLHQLEKTHDAFDFINLDIQGAELMALKGATKLLPYIRSIYTEVNIKELYEGCAQMFEIDDFLNTWGFKRVATEMTSHGWGDAFYIKRIE
jgi:FkbM family methyltransferase